MKAFSPIKNGLFFFLSVLLFVGCSSQDTAKAKTDTVEQDNYVPQTHIVEIKDMLFQPADVLVHIGDTVMWINKDIVAHDVTEDGQDWASPALANGASWKKVITENESYYCSIHVVMKGKVTVQE